ncbi:DUF1203 domain-containing protein [Streptomyces sp. CB00316]|uniref:DUF1203 domain-containing protein n=1 Tax=Streptomyces sp. CB00316 TaxID=1703932 RepID=UPI003B63AFF7
MPLRGSDSCQARGHLLGVRLGMRRFRHPSMGRALSAMSVSRRTRAAPGAYDEQGPVFIHAEECAGPAPAHPGYPFSRPGALRTVRRYDPEVALVHVRAVEYGCFHFEMRRP